MVAPGWAKRYPASGCTSPAAMRRRVDLPEPLRPTRQTRSPAATASSALESRGVTPKVRLMFWSISNGGGMGKEIPRDRCGQGIVSIGKQHVRDLGDLVTSSDYRVVGSNLAFHTAATRFDRTRHCRQAECDR